MTTTDVLEMQSATVADVAVKFPQATGVLDRYHLDYCCNGRKNFISVCENLELDAGSVWKEVMEISHLSASGHPLRFETWGTPFLIEYIVEHHHAYVREATTYIMELLRKVEAAHADDHPEVAQVRRTFGTLTQELLEHMTKEEVIVFPTVRRVAESQVPDTCSSDPLAGSIVRPIMEMEDEHEEAGKLIGQIRSLTNNYTPPIDACPTFQVTWRLLKEFDADLIQHIHLENNILFPRVKQLG
jgi:regulator of cell morphogenesis and NO signaling